MKIINLVQPKNDWSSLPRDILFSIINKFKSYQDVSILACICKEFNFICRLVRKYYMCQKINNNISKPLCGRFFMIISPGVNLDKVINQCPNNGNILLLPGNYLVNYRINIRKNISIFGNNKAYILDLCEKNVMKINCFGNSILLDGLRIECWNSIYIDSKYVCIKNCKILSRFKQTLILSSGLIHIINSSLYCYTNSKCSMSYGEAFCKVQNNNIYYASYKKDYLLDNCIIKFINMAYKKLIL